MKEESLVELAKRKWRQVLLLSGNHKSIEKAAEFFCSFFIALIDSI